jgi:hypothetical protein
LSAADFDKRIGDIKKSGLAAGFSEDDQKLIANLSRMNKEKGGYEIKVVDEQGQESYKKLTDLSADQLKATLEAEKTRPKDIEAVQRSQLNTQEGMLQNLREINEKILRGITGNQTAIRSVARGSEALRSGVRKGTETYFNQDFQDTMEKLEKKLASTTDATKRKEVLDELKKEALNMGGDVLDGFTNMLGKLKGGNLPIDNEKINELFAFFEASAKKTKVKKVGPELRDLGSITPTDTKINNDFLFGRNKAAESVVTGKVGGGGGVSVNETIEVKPISGKIDINVTATGADSKIIEEILSKGSVTLKERIFEIVTEQSKITPGRIK